MNIEKTLQDNHAVLHLKGEFDTFHCPVLAEEIEGLVASGVNRVILQMRLTSFVNSTALGAMIKAARRVRDAGGDLAIAHPSPFVKGVIEKVGLDRTLKMFPDEAKAAAYLATAKPAAARPAATVSDPMAETKSPVKVEDAATVMFTLADAGRRKRLGKEVGVGRLLAVEDTGLAFAYGGGDIRFDAIRAAEIFGSHAEMKVKFWLPLYKRRGPLEVAATVDSFEAQPDGAVRVKTRFGSLASEDKSAIQQFVRDMRFLKTELKGATGQA